MAQKRRPTFINKTASAAGVVVLALGLWSAWLLRSIFSTRGVIEETSKVVEKLTDAQELIYFNRLLGLSSRLYAETGNSKWEEEYRKGAEEMDRLFNEMRNSGLPEVEESLEKSRQAREVFRAIETRTLEVIRSGDLQEALVILKGPEYTRQKTIYVEGIEEAVNFQKNLVMDKLSGTIGRQRRLFYQLYALAMFFLISAVVSLFLLIERRRIENERLAMERELRHSQKVEAVGRMAAGVIHELKNPMAVILGLVETNLMSASGLSSTLKKDLEKIRDAGLRCQAFAANLLKFARKEAPESRPVNLNDILRETAELTTRQVADKGAELVTEPARGLPSAPADAGQIQQVMVNLILNAADALKEKPGGKIIVRTGSRPGWVHFQVTDNGPGIPEEVLSHIFDPFFTTKPKGEGSGLGLSICQGIVHGHRGKIRAENSPRGGAVFTVELPV